MNSATDVASATTLCDVQPKLSALALYRQCPSEILRRNGEDEQAEVGQVQRDRAGAFRGERLRFRLEIDLKREVCDRGAKCLRSLLSCARWGSGSIGWKTIVRHARVCNAGAGGVVVDRWTKGARERSTVELAASGVGSFDLRGVNSTVEVDIRRRSLQSLSITAKILISTTTTSSTISPPPLLLISFATALAIFQVGERFLESRCVRR